MDNIYKEYKECILYTDKEIQNADKEIQKNSYSNTLF